MRRRALFLALPLVLAACGGGGSKSYTPPANGGSNQGRSLSAVASAALKTQRAGTARFKLTSEFAGKSFGGSGAADYTNHRYQMSLDLGALGNGFSFETVYDGRYAYLKMPLLDKTFGKGKPWIRLKTAGPVGRRGEGVGQLFGGTVDPSQALALLRVGGFSRAGDETIDGVPVTHYRGTIDFSKKLSLGKIPPKMRDLVKPIAESLSSIAADAWVDRGGYLRRVKMQIPLGGDNFTQTQDFYDFGKPVDISPPAADQVADVSLQDLTKGVDQFPSR